MSITSVNPNQTKATSEASSLSLPCAKVSLGELSAMLVYNLRDHPIYLVTSSSILAVF